MHFYQEFRVRLKAKVWCYRGRINGRRVSDAGFDTREEAENAVAALRLKAREDKYGLTSTPGTVTFAALVEERENDFDMTKKTHRRAMSVLRKYAESLPAGFTVNELTEVHLRNYVIARREEFAEKMANLKKEAPAEEKDKFDRRLSDEALNRELGFISAMLTRAPKMFEELKGYVKPPIPWAQTSKRKRKRPIASHEQKTLLTGLRSRQQPGENPQTKVSRFDAADLFEIGLNTGMRGGETNKLMWTQVDFKSGEIDLGKTKNGESRRVPMNSRVLAILKQRFDARYSNFVFPNPDGSRHRYDYTKTFRRVAQSLGLPYGLWVENGFTMHATRHTATTKMIQRGNDVSTVQEIVGHSDKTMTLIYLHATSETRRKAVESLIDNSGDDE